MTCEGQSFLIWGGGGHGRVIADIIRAAGGTVAGFVDRNPALIDKIAEPGGGRVIIGEADLLRLLESRNKLPQGITAIALGIGDNAARSKARMALKDLTGPAIVHPSAVMSPSAKLGAYSAVFPRAVINAAAEIGAGAVINSSAVVEHDCRIGDDVHVGPGAVVTGGVRIGALTLIGAGAVIKPGIVIGSRVIVGAGSVVTRDLPDDVTAYGVPARIAKQ